MCVESRRKSRLWIKPNITNQTNRKCWLSFVGAVFNFNVGLIKPNCGYQAEQAAVVAVVNRQTANGFSSDIENERGH